MKRNTGGKMVADVAIRGRLFKFRSAAIIGFGDREMIALGLRLMRSRQDQEFLDEFVFGERMSISFTLQSGSVIVIEAWASAPATPLHTLHVLPDARKEIEGLALLLGAKRPAASKERKPSDLAEPPGSSVADLPTLLTRYRVSQVLDVCERTVDRMIGRGELTVARFGKSVRVSRASLERLIRTNTEK